MLSNDLVLKVENVEKCFEMYDEPVNRLLQIVWPGGRKFYKEFWALKNINFELKKGECIGIIGRNGAGKSTLLQIITGTLKPTSGMVETKGKIAALLELGSGFNPEFTGRENVYMNATILGFSKKQIDERFQDIVDFADIGEFIDKPVKIYSSGMLIRLAFSVQIMVEPDLLIVDEALAVGDAPFQFKCMTRIRELVKLGTSVLFVSHDTHTIKSFCDKCLWLKKGTIFAYGDSGKLTDDYEREVRMEIENTQKGNETNNDLHKIKDGTVDTKIATNNCNNWYEDTELDKKVAGCRYGNGDARVKGVVILDEDDNIVNKIRFGQLVTIKVFFETYKAQKKLAVTYLIKDAKQIPLLGYGSYMSNDGKCLDIGEGKYVIEFQTTFPITAGLYSVTVVLSEPTIHDTSSISFDYVDNTNIFFVEARNPDRIWSFAQVNNDVLVKKLVGDKLLCL